MCGLVQPGVTCISLSQRMVSSLFRLGIEEDLCNMCMSAPRYALLDTILDMHSLFGGRHMSVNRTWAYLWTTSSILPFLKAQISHTTFLGIETRGLLERLAQGA